MKTYIDVEVEVAVRKYEVDIPRLQEILKQYRRPPKTIAEDLDLPTTLVEHWFRRDRYFAIPTQNLWSVLKEYLGIEADEMDMQMTYVEYKQGDSRNRIYIGDVAPTLTVGRGDDMHLLEEML